jgi:integrase/recombinase XerC
MTDTALITTNPAAIALQPDATALVQTFLSGKSERTLTAYRQDLEDFRAFLAAGSLDEAAQILLGRGPGAANMTTLNYRAHLMERGLSASTVNRRLAALRSMVDLAQTVGMIGFALKVPGVKSQSYRDTRGPGDEGLRRMLAVVEARGDAKGIRDRALLRLLHDLALRRGEVVSLDLAHVNLPGRTVAVLGKGKTERIVLKMPEITRDALAAWIDVRGAAPGPLFTNLDRARKGDRLTGTSIYRTVQRIGQDAGLDVWPHGLRHLAITRALDVTSGNVRAVRDFSRHASIQTVMLYDDKRTSKQGEIAALVAGYAATQTVRGRSRQRMR